MSNPFRAKTQTFTLTETGVNVTIRAITLDEGLAFSSIQSLPEGERAMKIKEFLASVVTWDAVDPATKEAVPVSAETIGQLPLADGNQLITSTMAFVAPAPEEVKKGVAPSA